MKTRKFLAFVLVIAMVLGSVSVAFAASGTKKGTATTITLEKYTGSVTITNASGKEVKPREGAKLYSGYTIKTGKKSSANLLLDDKSALLIESSSKVQLNKSGKKIAVMLMSGTVLDVSEKLAKDQTLDIYTTNMVTGVRGTVPEVSHDSANDKSSSTTLQGTTEATEKTGGYSLKSTKIPAGYGASTTTEQVAVNRAENTGNQFVDAQQLPSQQEQFSAERKAFEDLQTETQKYTEVDRALQSNPEHQQGYEQAFFTGPQTPQDRESMASMIMEMLQTQNQEEDKKEQQIQQAVQEETPATQGEQTTQVFEKVETLPESKTETVTPVEQLPQPETQTPATPATTGGGGSDSSSSGDSGGNTPKTLTISVPKFVAEDINHNGYYMVYEGTVTPDMISSENYGTPNYPKEIVPTDNGTALVFTTEAGSATVFASIGVEQRIISAEITEMSFAGLDTKPEIHTDSETGQSFTTGYYATITNEGKPFDFTGKVNIKATVIDPWDSSVSMTHTVNYLFKNTLFGNETVSYPTWFASYIPSEYDSNRITLNPFTTVLVPIIADDSVSSGVKVFEGDTDAAFAAYKGAYDPIGEDTNRSDGSAKAYTTDAEKISFVYADLDDDFESLAFYPNVDGTTISGITTTVKQFTVGDKTHNVFIATVNAPGKDVALKWSVKQKAAGFTVTIPKANSDLATITLYEGSVANGSDLSALTPISPKDSTSDPLVYESSSSTITVAYTVPSSIVSTVDSLEFARVLNSGAETIQTTHRSSGVYTATLTNETSEIDSVTLCCDIGLMVFGETYEASRSVYDSYDQQSLYNRITVCCPFTQYKAFNNNGVKVDDLSIYSTLGFENWSADNQGVIKPNEVGDPNPSYYYVMVRSEFGKDYITSSDIAPIISYETQISYFSEITVSTPNNDNPDKPIISNYVSDGWYYGSTLVCDSELQITDDECIIHPMYHIAESGELYSLGELAKSPNTVSVANATGTITITVPQTDSYYATVNVYRAGSQTPLASLTNVEAGEFKFEYVTTHLGIAELSFVPVVEVNGGKTLYSSLSTNKTIDEQTERFYTNEDSTGGISTSFSLMCDVEATVLLESETDTESYNTVLYFLSDPLFLHRSINCNVGSYPGLTNTFFTMGLNNVNPNKYYEVAVCSTYYDDEVGLECFGCKYNNWSVEKGQSIELTNQGITTISAIIDQDENPTTFVFDGFAIVESDGSYSTTTHTTGAFTPQSDVNLVAIYHYKTMKDDQVVTNYISIDHLANTATKIVSVQ